MYSWVCPVSEGIGGCGDLNVFLYMNATIGVIRKEVFNPFFLSHVQFLCLYLEFSQVIPLSATSTYSDVVGAFFLPAIKSTIRIHAIIWISFLSESVHSPSPTRIISSLSTNIIAILLNYVTDILPYFFNFVVLSINCDIHGSHLLVLVLYSPILGPDT